VGALMANRQLNSFIFEFAGVDQYLAFIGYKQFF
jgi:hypothetical protein